MKLTVFLLFITLVQASAKSYTQAITLNRKNAAVSDVLSAIEKQSDFVFFYDNRDLPRAPINVEVRNATIGDVMRAAFGKFPVNYKIVGKNVIISRPARPAPTGSDPLVSVPQPDSVRGRVTDKEGGALPGVSVTIRGTNRGTATDINGNYALPGVSPTDTLQFSYIGFGEVRIVVGNQRQISVTMEPSTTNLDQMVVIGYGTVKRSDLTGSVSTIKAEDFNPAETGSVQGLIQGKMPGVRVVERSGAPGGGFGISIRGASSITAGTGPLWVVDGSPLAGGLRTINPDDIASIEVLKDASATAIYGSRGSGGVIMVTTKKGSNTPLRVNYHGAVGFSKPVNNIELLSPEQYQQVTNEIIDAGGGNPEDRVEDTGAATDWMSEIFDPGAYEQHHSLSFSGNMNGLGYYVSLNATNENGVIKNSEFARYGGRINLEYNGSEKFKFGTNLRVSHIEDQLIRQGGVNENAGAVYAALFFDPTLPVKDDEGRFVESDQLTINNPMAILEGEDRTANINLFAGNAYGEYSILPSLKARVNVGFNIGNNKNDTYIGRMTLVGRARGGVADINQSQHLNHFIEGTLRYDKTFNDHHLNMMVGGETQNFSDLSTSMQAENFVNDGTGVDNIGLGNSETFQLGSNKTNNRLLSAFGRVNYTFRDRYMLTATLRADGSTRFGTNNKFGYFPSFAVAWHMGKEPFMDGVNFISELKPRISWGQTGNQSIGNYLSILTYRRGANATWDNAQVVGITPARMPNPDIRWEGSEQLDIGLDVALFNARVLLNFDYFQQKTFDMLMSVPLPRETGFASQVQNIGSISNKGIEVNLQTRNIARQDFAWSSNIALSTIKNEVTDLGETQQIISGNSGFTNSIFLTTVGLPLRSYYGYEVAGIWQTDDDFSQTSQKVQPGDIKYVDQNQDGVVNSDDRVELGNSFPELTWSFGNNISYKNLELSIFLEAIGGISMLNNNLVDTYFPLQNRRNKFAEPYLNRWTEDNPSNKYPSFLSPGSQGQNVVNSITVEDASYIRLKNVQLAYTLPASLLGRALHSAQIYVSATNLKTWSDYSGFDPALGSQGDVNSRIDYNAYPLARTFQVGVKIGL